MADDFASAETSVENREEGLLKTRLDQLQNQPGKLDRLEHSEVETRNNELEKLRLEESERQRRDLARKVAFLERNSPEPDFLVAETYGPDRSTKGPSMEPCNCELIDVVYLPNESDAEQAARNYYLEKPKQNCCTIYGCQVTKWSLPSPSSPRNMVKLKEAAVDVYFLCHIDLDVEW